MGRRKARSAHAKAAQSIAQSSPASISSPPNQTVHEEGTRGAAFSGDQRTLLLELEPNIISRILDLIQGSAADLAHFEVSLPCSVRAEVINSSFQGEYCERWSRVIAAETDLCLHIPIDVLTDCSLRDGTLVRMSGLKHKAGLNGRLMLAQKEDIESGRWACKLLHDGRIISCKRENLVVFQGMLPTSALKEALCLRGISFGLNGGWGGLTSAQFLRGMQLLEGIHAEKPHGRIMQPDLVRQEFLAPFMIQKTAKKIQLERMLLAHFDVFFDDSIIPVVEAFKQNNLNSMGVARTRPVDIEIDGETTELVLKLENIYGSSNNDASEAPEPEPSVGLSVHLDFDEFKLRANNGPAGNTLIISYALVSSFHEHMHSLNILTKVDSTLHEHGLHPEYQHLHGLYYPKDEEHLFYFDQAASGHYHVATLLLYEGSAAQGQAPFWAENTWRSKRGLMEGSPVIRTATWNRDLPSTGIAPIVFPEQDDQALKPFPQGAFDGAIALIRRGGGNGFAHKAAAAEAAGAVGCIIFNGDDRGPLEHWGEEPGMGLIFEDIILPKPGIPTVLVDNDVGQQLARNARSCSRSACSASSPHAQILVDSSRETLQKLPPELEEFMRKAVAGEPLHMAILAERKVR